MKRIAHYEIGRVLGEGGSATVYEALDSVSGEKVAVKQLHPGSDARAVVRFVREASLLRAVASDFIVRVLDIGVEDELPFLVMELLTGSPLSDSIGSGRSLDIATAADVLMQACCGVVELHARNIIHRDIKPANLFVVDRTRIKLLDLGISKTLPSAWSRDGTATKSDVVLGTPYFMSPEQLRNARNVDGRTDIWSLGVVLYIAVTGYYPFAGASLAEIATAIIDSAPLPLAAHRVRAPDIEEIILRCLEKEPAKRYPNVTELATALAPIASPHWVLLADDIANIANAPTHVGPRPRR